MNHVFGLRVLKDTTKNTNLATIGKHWSAKVSGIGWPWKGQDAMWKGRYRHVLTLIMHIVSISVKGNKLRCWKRDFGDKSAGGCPTYHAMAPWPHLTRSFFAKSCPKMPISYAKFKRDLNLKWSKHLSVKMIIKSYDHFYFLFRSLEAEMDATFPDTSRFLIFISVP